MGLKIVPLDATDFFHRASPPIELLFSRRTSRLFDLSGRPGSVPKEHVIERSNITT
jgi:hypothetical protein